MFDLFGMMDKIQKLKGAVEETKERMDRTEVQGQSQNSLITVVATGNKHIKDISIDASLLHPDQKEALEDFVVAAVNDALKNAHRTNKEAMKQATEGLIPNIPGLDLSRIMG